MHTRDLEFLHNLIRTRSVSDTAKVMHTTQPNASKMLKRLEEHFGFQLVERMNGRLYPTEEGRLIAEQAESSLISLRQLETRASNLREMRHGSLTVGTTPQLSRDFVPEVVSTFMLSHPAVTASIHTRNSQALVELVSQRQLDFAIGLLSVDDPNVECRKLFDVELMASMKKGHPLAAKSRLRPKDFHQQDFITASMLDRSREQIEEFFLAEDSRPIERGEASLSYTRMRMVEQGIGLTMVDALFAKEYTNDKIEFRPLEPALHLNVWLMKSRLQPKSKVIDAFMRLVIEQAERMNT